MKRSPVLLVWLFFLYAISLPFFDFSLYNLGERVFARPDWLIAGALVVFFVFHLMVDRPSFRLDAVSKRAVLFVYVGMLSMVNLFNASSAQIIDFLTAASQYLLMVATLIVISNLELTEGQLRNVIRIWVFTAYIVSLYAIYQVFARAFDLPLAYLTLANPTTPQGGMRMRIQYGYAQSTSIMREPSYLGAYLVGPLVLSSIVILYGRGIHFFFKGRQFNWLMLFTLLAGLILSGAQGAYATLFVTLGLVLLSKKLEKAVVVKQVLAGVLVFLGAATVLSLVDVGFLQYISYRFTYLLINIRDPFGTAPATSVVGRLTGSLAALRVWASHPLLGVGFNSLAYHASGVRVADNPWAQLLADVGLLGASIFAAFLLRLLVSLNKVLSAIDPDSDWHPVLVGMFFVIVSGIVKGFISSVWSSPQRWFTLSLANLLCLCFTRYRFVSQSRVESASDIREPGR